MWGLGSSWQCCSQREGHREVGLSDKGTSPAPTPRRGGLPIASRGTGEATLSPRRFAGSPEVQTMLRRLEEEKPPDLQTWLRDFAEGMGRNGQQHGGGLRRSASASSSTASPKRGSVLSPSFNAMPEEWQEQEVEDLYEMLDWRFFILNKEKEVGDRSNRVVHSKLEKEFEPAPVHFYSFVPRVISDAMERGQISLTNAHQIINSTPIKSAYDPVVATFDAVVVFADASGFTALTESMAQRPHGAEEIGACLNDFFDPLIELVIGYGGDVLKFSGDAITVLWRVPPSETEEGAAAAARACASTACRCCLDIQSKVASFGHTPVPGITLGLHIGVGFGHLSVLQIGGVMDRWEYCAVGPPLEEVAHAEELAKTGETVLSCSVHQLLGADGQGFRFGHAAGHGEAGAAEGPLRGYVKLLGASKAIDANEPPSPSKSRSKRSSTGPMSCVDARLVYRFIPKAALMHLSSRKSDVDAEMRRVAVIFLAIKGLDPVVPGDAKRTQLLMRLFQRTVYALEGSVNKFLVDDKGMLLLVCWGLPPMNHYSDDPVRAVLAAQRFCDTLMEEGVHGSAGVATGTCWCGIMGSRLRREYTVLGNVVNLSARLMAKAKSDTVYVDQATREACKGILDFESLGDFSLKGKANPVAVFRFTGNLVPRSVQKQTELQSPLLSWDAWPVRAKLDKALQAQLKHAEGPGGIILVTGGPGSGKTQAAQLVKTWAAARGYAVLTGQNMNPTATFAVPRLVWQEVFGGLIGHASGDPYWHNLIAKSSNSPTRSPKLYQLVKALLSDAEKELMSWAPLLSFVVPGLNFGAKGVSALLERDEQRTTGKPRLAHLSALVLDAFATHSSGTAGTIVLVHMKRGTSFDHETYSHDGHILHAVADLCVRRRAAAARPGGKPLILCVVAQQEVLEDRSLLADAKALKGVVHLNDLAYEEVEGYLSHLLKAPGGVASRIVDHVYEVCGGNPVGIELVAKALEDYNVLQRSPAGNVCPAPEWERSEKVQEIMYLEDLKGLQLATFEKLSPVEQQLLKTAAVCGSHEFRVTDVAFSLGVASNSEVEETCTRLCEKGILRPSRNRRHITTTDVLKMTPGMCVFTFTSAVMRHVASTLVLQVQKEKISKSVRRTIYRHDTGSLSLAG